MSPLPASGRHALGTPRFYVTPTQRVSPGIVLLAVLIALGCIPPVLYALSHSHHAQLSRSLLSTLEPGHANFGAGSDDDDDNPNQVDTIYLGDPGEAPVTSRPGSHASTVHPFITVQLPRSGAQVGQIPASPAGHLLYHWLAAFNSKDPSASGQALPSENVGVAEAQIELRKETGGFTLLSSKEVQTGVLVFRLHDQTASANEVIGTLQMRPNSSPPAIASFSLRAVAPLQAKLP